MGTGKQTSVPQTSVEMELIDDIEKFYDDPLGFVHYVFAWGDGELKDHTGPDIWQAEQLMRIGDRIKDDPECTIREAIASGHGIGKSAEVAWIILWAMSTRPHLAGVVTANTTNQLTTKTWRELAVWHKRLINQHWFKWTATKFFHIEHPETWFVNATPNTEHNSEAFAGLHGTHVLIIYDEGSGIPDKIFQVSEGAMTDPRAMWFVYGNPTKNTGKFREIFKPGTRWVVHQIDSRSCKMTNKEEIQAQIEEYGEDSDFCRVRIKGQFPRVGSMQFISSEVVDNARYWEAPFETYYMMPVLMGVDVARFGEDKSVIVVRQGRKVLEIRDYTQIDTMELVRKVIQAKKEFNPVAVFVDGIGIGAGVVDRLIQLGHEVFEVISSAKPQDDVVYKNKRTEMWDKMRAWLTRGADIPETDIGLKNDLISIEYGFNEDDKMVLESKKDMKKRGILSPDRGSALAFTFAEEVGDLVNNSFEPDNFEPGPSGMADVA